MFLPRVLPQLAPLAYAFRMLEGKVSQSINDALAALRAKDAATAAAILRPLAETMSSQDFPWAALANAEIMLSNLDAAAVVVDRRLARAPRDVGALLQRGWLHEEAGSTRAAVSFYQAARN